VIIGMHHEQDMRKMGGLRKYMPITWITSLIGTLALVGTPFFSGFYSKDSIIEARHRGTASTAARCSSTRCGRCCSACSSPAFYSFRLLYLTFHGKERFRDGHAHGHEAHAHDDAHGSA
jgi:NADH-quinone oxidoreductase subunit L